MIVAIIPARKGSTRIKNKNIKLFNEKPIIYWPILQLKKSKIFDKIIVSTDSKKIQSIVKKLGVSSPFIRPAKLATNYSSTSSVIKHSLDWLKKENLKPKYVCCVYPTSVFFNSIDIKKSFKKFKKSKINFLFSASKFKSSIFRSFYFSKKSKLNMLFPKYYNTRTQDLKETFHDAAQFYWGTEKAWNKELRIYDKKSKLYFLEDWKINDIDNKHDWKIAEKLFKLNNHI